MIESGRRTAIAVSLLVSIVAGTSAFYGYMKQLGADDDDLLYLHSSAYAIGAAGEYRRMTDVMIDAQKAIGYPAPYLVRLELRRDYIGNYLLASGIYRITDSLLDRIALDLQSPRGIPGSTQRGEIYPFHMEAGFTASFLVCLGAVLWIVARDDDWRPSVAMAVTVSGLAFYALQPAGGDQRFVYLWYTAPSQLVDNAIAFFKNPRWYSFLHFTPRSNFALLLLGVFALRWQGRLAGSYWFLVLASLFHQSNALLMAGILIAIDVLSNPAFIRPRVMVPAVISVIVGARRDSVWPHIFSAPYFITAVVLVLAAVAGVVASRLLKEAMPGWLRGLLRIRERIGRFGRAQTDVVLLVASWLLLFAICAVAYRHATGDQNLYFFQQANGRMLALIQPALVFGVVLTILRLWRPRHALATAIPVGLVLAVALVASIQEAKAAAAIKEELVNGLRERMPLYEQRMRTPPFQARMDEQEVENILYYSLSRSLDAGTDFVTPLVR